MGRLWTNPLCVLCLATVIFQLSAVVSGQSFVGPNPQEVAVEEDDITLLCRLGVPAPPGTISVWSRDGDTFATLAGLALTTGVYANFAIITDDTAIGQMDLVISDAEYEDRGDYRCSFTADGVATTQDAVLTVEDQVSDVVIQRDGDVLPSPTTIDVTDGEVFTLVCTAYDARPTVQLNWFNGNEEVTGDTETTNVNIGDPDTMDTVSTQVFTATRADRGKLLVCQTMGQQAAMAQSESVTLNVQFIPEVTVSYANKLITCSADANPIDGIVYQIILNGTKADIEGSTLSFNPDDYYCTTIKCNVTNNIGTGMGEIDEAICAGDSTTTPAMSTTGYVPSTTPSPTKDPEATKTTPPPSGSDGLSTGAIVGIVIGAVVGVLVVVLLLIYCFTAGLLCFASVKKSSPSSINNTLPKKQPSVANTDMIRNQPEVRQSVHKYDDEPRGESKKPRVARSSVPPTSGSSPPVIKGDKRSSPAKTNAASSRPEKDYRDIPMDAYDGQNQNRAQGNLNYADIDFQGNGLPSNQVRPPVEEPSQYASILV